VSDASRLLRGTLPCLVALTAAVSFVLPANASQQAGAARSAESPGVTRAGEWWLTTLNVPAAWRAAPAEGKGVVVAVLSTGIDAAHPDLAGAVIAGRDYCDSGRTAAGPFWGYEGTAVASLLAGHGHGPRSGHGSGHGVPGTDGITGVAPNARILAVQVTLEYNDPLNADSAITRRLPDAIAAGIRYAVAHGATVIALPLDPGTLGPVTSGDPAAAGGSPAERAAVSYALARNVVLIAPAGDNGASTGTVNYPAAYPGVVAVGATVRGGQLASFTSRNSYVALTAPGSGLRVADPDGGYSTLASTDMSAALTAGVAALIRSRFPKLTAAQVAKALQAGTLQAGKLPGGTRHAAAHQAPGAGNGALNAANALTVAAAFIATRSVPAPTAPPAAPTQAPRPPPHHPAAASPGLSGLAGSLLRWMVIVVCVLIAAAGCALALTAMRRRAQFGRRAPRSGRGGSHARRPNAPASQSRPAAQPRTSAWGQTRAIGSGNPPYALGAGGTAARAALGTGSHAIGASSADITSDRVIGAGRQPRAIGAGGASAGVPRIVPGTVGAGARARRARQATGQPPWESAGQPEATRPAVPVFPAAPAGGHPDPRGQDAALPPWETAPAEFAAAPVPAADLAGWSATNSGPMYLWNPNATTGPQPVVRVDDSEIQDHRP
jgi:subtilisin family serine protease